MKNGSDGCSRVDLRKLNQLRAFQCLVKTFDLLPTELVLFDFLEFLKNLFFVFHQAESELLVDTPLEMRVVLPVGGEVERSLPEILCQGHVVRTILDRQQAGQPALAAAITRYRIRGENPGTLR